MKVVVLCSLLFALFGFNHGYVVQRTLPLDPEVINDIYNLTMSLKDSLSYQATVNEVGDKILANLDKMLVAKKVDPVKIDDIYKGYWWGNLQVTKIEMTGLATLYRPAKDAIMTYTHNNKQLQLDLPLSFGDLKFSCHYSASLLFVGPGGDLIGEVPDLLMEASIIVDFNVNQAFLRTFEVPDSGHISIHVYSNILNDWFYNLLSDAITAMFHGTILDSLKGLIQGVFEQLVEAINRLLQAILG